MSQLPAAKTRFRDICKEDASELADLLAKAFPARPRAYWEHSLAVLASREVPEGYPRYGYAIESGGRIVGVLLVVCSRPNDQGGSVRCNFSSWYVEPVFRSHAALLVAFVLKRLSGTTFTNISSERHTRPIIEAQGFVRYSDGTFITAPLLSWSGHGARARTFSSVEAAMLPPDEQRLLAEHAGYGCLSAVVTHAGRVTPLVFRRVRLKGVTMAQLVWCRDVNDLVQFAGAVGRFLAMHGMALLAIDANGRVAGLPGRYFPDRAPKYYRGPARPRSGDLSYSELALFG